MVRVGDAITVSQCVTEDGRLVRDVTVHVDRVMHLECGRTRIEATRPGGNRRSMHVHEANCGFHLRNPWDGPVTWSIAPREKRVSAMRGRAVRPMVVSEQLSLI